MGKKMSEMPHRRGRISLNLKRRCVGLTEEDYEWFKKLGVGCISGGIRRAAELLRKEGIMR